MAKDRCATRKRSLCDTENFSYPVPGTGYEKSYKTSTTIVTILENLDEMFRAAEHTHGKSGRGWEPQVRLQVIHNRNARGF